MNNITTKVFAFKDKEYGTVEFPVKRNFFHIQSFTHYGGQEDPAGLCDNGDYNRELKIKLMENNTVSVSWEKNEYSKIGTEEHNYFHDVPYEKFFDVLLKYLPQIKKECLSTE